MRRYLHANQEGFSVMPQLSKNKKLCKRRVFRLTAMYGLFSIVVILLVEGFLPLLFHSLVFSAVGLLKGWFYAILSTCFVFCLIHFECKKHPNDRVLKEIFQNNQLHIYLLDLTGEIVYVNPSVLAVSSTGNNRVVEGLYFWECPWWIDDADLKNRFLFEIEQAVKGESVNGEWEQVDQDGKKHHIAYSVIGVPDEYGDVHQLLIEGRDITPLRTLEADYSRARKQQDIILNSLPMSFYSYQPLEQDKKLWISSQIKRVTGFPVEYITEKNENWVARIHPDVVEEVVEAKRDIIHSGEFKLEYQWQVANGDFRWFRDEAVYVMGEEGTPPEVVGVCVDITEQKEYLQDLQLMKNCLEHNTVAMLIFSVDQNCLFSNRAATDLFNYSTEEFYGIQPSVLQAQPANWQKDVAKVKLTGPLTEELKLVKKNGDTFPAMVSCTFMELNKIEFIFFSYHDLSSRKMMEKSLVQAQKLESLGTLASGLAHDYNNILSAIFGYTQLAKMNAGSPDRQENALNGIYNATVRAKELVQQILTFSRKTRNEKSILQLSVLAKEVMKFLRQSIPATIEMETSIESESLVLMNPSQIHQVYVNLCTNAAQAMQEAGGVLKSRLYNMQFSEVDNGGESVIPKGEYVCLEISDTGSGMDEETLSKMYDPYFSTQQKAEGRGLGLAVVHGIVVDHGGYLRVLSKLHEGTTFQAFFPRVERKKDEVNSQNVNLESLRGYEHILFVDDDDAIVNVTSKVLQRNGYKVTSCMNGVEGWDLFKENSDDFDILITDLTMPKMTGIELSAKVREADANIPIIICSGNQDHLSKERIDGLNIQRFVEKPYHMKHLIGHVRECLDGALGNE